MKTWNKEVFERLAKTSINKSWSLQYQWVIEEKQKNNQFKKNWLSQNGKQTKALFQFAKDTANVFVILYK